MNFRLLGIFCSVAAVITCCNVDESVDEDETMPIVEDDDEGSFVTPTPSEKSTKESEPEDEEFDPCPSVRYLLLERGGIEYYVEIEVFCEPIQNMNLGCPSPI